MQNYPLAWPLGWPRTAAHKRERSQFNTSQQRAQINLMEEIRRLGGRDVVLSTNIRVRQDGLPYASQRAPEDPGVAVYFTFKKRPMVFACDRWDRIQDNIHAIGKTIDALRGIQRWGASDMLERAFTGFAALQAPPAQAWRDVLHVSDDCSLDQCERNFRTLAQSVHPDRGGDPAAFQRLVAARDQARRELGA